MPGVKYLLVAVCCLAALLTGCRYIAQTTIPIGSDYYVYDENNRELIILLPGIGEPPTAFVKYGVVEAIRQCRPQANILGVEAHFGYYRDRSLVARLREDIIDTAAGNGKQIWLLGNSLGGLGSLIYSQMYPEDISRVFLMAPYIGEWQELSTYLQQKNQSSPNPTTVSSKDKTKSLNKDFVQLWDWLSNATGEPERPMITMAYGEDDKFKPQLQWLAGQLEPHNVFTAEGKHRWKVWRQLWPTLLQRSGACQATFSKDSPSPAVDLAMPLLYSTRPS